VAKAKNGGSFYKLHIFYFEKFRPHIIAKAYPTKSRHNHSQKPKPLTINAAEQNNHIQKRKRSPNFDYPLKNHIRLSAQISLNAAYHYAKKSPYQREQKAKAHANPEPVDQPG